MGLCAALLLIWALVTTGNSAPTDRNNNPTTLNPINKGEGGLNHEDNYKPAEENALLTANITAEKWDNGGEVMLLPFIDKVLSNLNPNKPQPGASGKTELDHTDGGKDHGDSYKAIEKNVPLTTDRQPQD